MQNRNHFVGAAILLSSCMIEVPAVAADQFSTPTLTSVEDLLKNYDCQKPSAATQNVGQVIEGIYQEWAQEMYAHEASVGVACIRLKVPFPKTLDQNEAKEFLTRSRKIGEAPASGVEKERAQEHNSDDVIEEMRRKASPMPPLRVREATPESAASSHSVAGSYQESSAPTVALQTLTDKPRYGIFEWGVSGSGKTRTVGGKAPASASDVDVERTSEVVERPATAGVDERIRIGPIFYPANVVGKLYSEYQDGSIFSCTATLVSAYVALTAGHCLHSRDRNGYATRVAFVPYQTQTSFGGAVATPYSYKLASYITVNARWTQISGGSTILATDSRYDYGAVYFSTPWTFTGTFLPVAYGSTSAEVINFGYPARVQGTDGNEGEWADLGSENARSLLLLRPYQVREFELDISGGNSGGPYIGNNNVTLFLVGIVSYGYDDNGGGVWLGGANESVVRGYAGWTPAAAAPSAVSSDLRAPIILSSNVQEGESYLRFFNNSPSSGAVTARFYDLFGAQVGVWTSPQIAPFASRQFFMRDIERQAPITVGKNILYSAKFSSTFTGLFQHVAWNVEGAGLTNLSGCSNGLSTNIAAAINVHSSLLDSSYPSYIVLHSLEQSTSDITADVYDSTTGVRLGGVIFRNMSGNASGIVTIDDIEQLMGYKPTANQYQYNIVLSGNNAAYIQHQVDNVGAGMVTNMTGACKL